MTIQNLGTLSLVKIGAPAVTLGGIISGGVDPGVKTLVEASDGAVDPTYIAVGEQDPAITFSTRHLAVALAACGIAGCQITNLDTYFQQIAKYSTRATGTAHLRIRAADGLLIPQNISVQQGQGPASLSMALFPAGDGTACPVALLAAQTLPTGGGTSEAFTLGPCSINGTSFAAVGLQIDFGISVQNEKSDGQVWASYPFILARKPSIRVTTLDSLTLNSLGISGVGQGATDSIFYLRKLARASTRVADATAQHISFGVTDGMIYCGPISNSQGQRIGTEIIVTPISDGANPIIVINAATAIT